MYIGDSLLNYMSINDIKNDLKEQINWPHTDKKFQRVEKYEDILKIMSMLHP